jgi:hypothetical protein
MRRTHNPQLILSEPYIAGNKINLKSRDDILVILTRTAQQIYLEASVYYIARISYE